MATKLGITERTRIVPRNVGTPDTSVAQVGDALSGFFGKVHESEKAKEKAAREKGIANAQSDVSRLIASNPEAARELRNSGDFEAFSNTTGLKLGPEIKDLVMTNEALKETVGTTFAVEGRSDLREALRNIKPNQTTTQVVAEYIKSSTANLGPEAARSFGIATMKFAESDSISIADKRRREVQKAQREQITRNVKSFFPEAGVINEQVAGLGINKMVEALVSTGLDPFTANVKAADNYEAMVIQGRAEGQPWATAASRVAYAGRKSMEEDPKLKNLLDAADTKAISTEINIQNRAEMQSFQGVEQLWNVTKAADFSPSSLNSFATSLHREINKYRKGKLLANEWRGLLAKLATAYKTGATKNVDFSNFLAGQTIINSKVTKALYTKEGEDRVMAAKGLNREQARILIDSGIAAQGPDGVGNQQRGVFTQSLVGQTDDGVAIEAYNRIKRLENSGRKLPGEGRYYDKEATPMVRALDYYTAGPDNISGTADDTNLKRAMERYRQNLEDNDGKLPGEGFLSKTSGGLGFTKPQILVAENKVLEKLEDLVGTSIGSGRGLRIRANRALGLAAWITSKTIPTGSLKNADSTIQLAASMMQRESQVNVGIDDDGAVYRTVGSRNSRMPAMQGVQIDAFKQSVESTLPESMRPEGYALRTDALSDQTNSRVVQITTADGLPEDAVFQPGDEINVEASEENLPIVQKLGVNRRLPAAGEAGQVTFLVPARPASAGATVDISKHLFMRYDGAVWKLRHRTVENITSVKTLDAAQSFRQEAIDTEEAELKRTMLRSQADIGNITDKHAETTDVAGDPGDVLQAAQKQSIKDGTLFDDVDSTFVNNVADDMRRISVSSPVVVNRKTNTDANGVRSGDQVIGINFNLDRSDASGMLAEAIGSNAEAKQVMKGKRGLTREEMNSLHKIGIKDTLTILRKRIGAEALSEMSTGQISAIVGVVETGAYTNGKPSVLTPAMVKALQAGDGVLVASLLEQTVLSTQTADVKVMSNSDLRKLASIKPGTPGLGTEIGRRRKAGVWKMQDPDNTKHHVLLNSITVSKARLAAIRAFNPPTPLAPLDSFPSVP